jgi:hypothetical protein
MNETDDEVSGKKTDAAFDGAPVRLDPEWAARLVSHFRNLSGTQALAEIHKLGEASLRSLFEAPPGRCNPFLRGYIEVRLDLLADRARAQTVAAKISRGG